MRPKNLKSPHLVLVFPKYDPDAKKVEVNNNKKKLKLLGKLKHSANNWGAEGKMKITTTKLTTLKAIHTHRKIHSPKALLLDARRYKIIRCSSIILKPKNKKAYWGNEETSAGYISYLDDTFEIQFSELKYFLLRNKWLKVEASNSQHLVQNCHHNISSRPASCI